MNGIYFSVNLACGEKSSISLFLFNIVVDEIESSRGPLNKFTHNESDCNSIDGDKVECEETLLGKIDCKCSWDLFKFNSINAEFDN